MPLPPDMKFRFKQLDHERVKAETCLSSLILNDPLTGAAYNQMLSLASAFTYVPVEDTQKYANLQWSLTYFHGKTLTTALRHELVWRITAGRLRFEAGLRVHPEFVAAPENEWTGLTIEDVRYGIPTSKGKPRYSITFRIHSGQFAGLTFVDLLPAAWVRYRIARDIGFPRFKPMHFREIVQCVIVGELAVIDPLRPLMTEFAAPGPVLTYNRALRKKRASECPRGKQSPCHNCIAGYAASLGQDEICSRATHTYSYIQKTCSRCQHQSYFDPSGDQTVCLLCREEEQFKCERQFS